MEVAIISGPWPEQPGDPPIPYEGLGRVVAAFANLEIWVNLLIAKLINPHSPRPGSIVLQKINRIPPACEMAIKLLPESPLDPKTRAACEAVLKEAIDANQRRNTFVHSSWFHGRSDGDTVIIRAGVTASKSVAVNPEKLGDAFAQVTPEELNDFKREIVSLTHRISDIAAALPGFYVPPRRT